MSKHSLILGRPHNCVLCRHALSSRIEREHIFPLSKVSDRVSRMKVISPWKESSEKKVYIQVQTRDYILVNSRRIVGKF